MYSRQQTPQEQSNYSEASANQEDANQEQIPDLDEESEKSSRSGTLSKYAKSINIAEDLEEDVLADIGNKILSGVRDDKTSQRLWLSQVEDALRLSKLVREPKNYPLPQSANIKYPLITNACYQYAARTYPEVIKDGRVAKAEVLTKDPTGLLYEIGEALSIHMSGTLLGESTTWERNLDQLLVTYSNIGFVCKKKFYNPITMIVDEILCSHEDLILKNSTEVHSLEDLSRITHVLHVSTNDLIEGCRYGIYLEDAVEELVSRHIETQQQTKIDLYECHCFLDLDEDDYQEPYIVTCEINSGKVLRIVARYQEEDVKYGKSNEIKCITPFQHFVDYHFLPSPDGSFMSMGFGTLMLHLNETVNTILNQLIDAGSLANLQFGFIDARLKIVGGQQYNDPGVWNKVKGVASGAGGKLQDMVLPMNYKEPSNVLYQLLGLLIESSKELAASTDIMSGQQNSQNSPANTTAILAEQGMKLYSSIQRRLYRSLKDEFQKIHRLIRIYADPKEMVLVGEQEIPVTDLYSVSSLKVIPIADPNLSSDAQRMSKINMLAQLTQNQALAPYINAKEIVMAVAQWLNIPSPQRFVQNPPPQPNPDMMKIQAQAQAKAADHSIKQQQEDRKTKEFAAKLAKMEAEITQLQANSVKQIAQAHKDAHSAKAQDMSTQLDMVKYHADHATQAHTQAVAADIQNKELQLQAQKQQQDHQRALTDQQQNQQSLDQDAQANENNQNTSNGVDGQSSNQGPAQGN